MRMASPVESTLLRTQLRYVPDPIRGESRMNTHLVQFRRFARYNTWFNDRLYALVASLTEEERQRDLGAFFGSIHGTLKPSVSTSKPAICRRLKTGQRCPGGIGCTTGPVDPEAGLPGPGDTPPPRLGAVKDAAAKRARAARSLTAPSLGGICARSDFPGCHGVGSIRDRGTWGILRSRFSKNRSGRGLRARSSACRAPGRGTLTRSSVQRQQGIRWCGASASFSVRT